MDKAVNYQRIVGVSAVALVSTFALLPENALINYNSSIVPVLSGLAFVLLEFTPSAGRSIDALSRGVAVCWWIWVCYSPMWYHHRYVWWSGPSVLVLSLATCAYNGLAWCVLRNYTKLPAEASRFESQLYYVLVAITLCMPHHYCVVHMLPKWEVTARTLAYLLCCWFDFLYVLRADANPRDAALWFSNKWWVLYVHTWFLPLVCVMWVWSVTALYSAPVTLESDKASDPGVPDVLDACSDADKRYMFQTPEEEHAGRQSLRPRSSARMVSAWNARQPDVSELVAMADGVAAISETVSVSGSSSASNPFDNVATQ